MLYNIETTEIACDFETDFICGYANDPTTRNTFWMRSTGLSDTTETGPTADVTTGSIYGNAITIKVFND